MHTHTYIYVYIYHILGIYTYMHTHIYIYTCIYHILGKGKIRGAGHAAICMYMFVYIHI